MRMFNPPNLSGVRELVYDTETKGTDWKKDCVVGYVLTWGPKIDNTVYYPVRHEKGGNFDPIQVESWLRDLARDKSIRWTGHNMKFDLHMSANHNIFFSGDVNCTQVNAALIDEAQEGGYSLDACARAYGVIEKKGHALYAHMAEVFGGPPERKQMKNFWRLSGEDPIAVDYAIGDGQSTWHIWEHQKNFIKKIDSFDASLIKVWEVECKVIRTLFHMERRGVKIDLQRYEEIKDLINKRIIGAKSKFRSDFKPMSNQQVHRLLVDSGITGGWKCSSKTGAPSFSSEFLSTIPLGRDILRLRKLNHLLSTFIEGQVANHLHKGRVHTNYNQLKMDDYGTVTGRLSSSGPNLQQVPKRDKELAKLFRSIFVPDEGYIWSSNDYKQQEFVVFAHYSKSKRLIDGYNQEPQIDMHTSVGEMMGVPRNPTAKQINLGKLYWMGVPKLASVLGVSEEQARVLSQKWDQSVPEASVFRHDAKKLAETRGFVRSFLGRRRRFYGESTPSEHRKSKTYQAANAIIQMSSADITKLKMAEIDNYFQETGDICHLLLQVHDELNWQYPKDKGIHNKEALRIMCNFSPDQPICLRARLDVDPSYGYNWAEATFNDE